MKKNIILSAIALAAITFTTNAQNTFPSSGNTGIGTSSPTELLEVSGNTKIDGDLLMNTSSFINLDKTKGSSYYNYGAVGINFKRTGALNYKLYVSHYPGPGTGMLHLVNNSELGIHMSGPGIYFGANQIYSAMAPFHFDNIVFAPNHRIGLKVGGDWADGHVAIGANDKPAVAIRSSHNAYGYASVIECKGDEPVKAFAVRTHEGEFDTPQSDKFIVMSDGATRIGGSDNGGVWPFGYMLAVNGKVLCEEIKVEMSNTWGDFVFDKDYHLMSLKETEAYINENKHLPGIPDAATIEDSGLEMGEMLRNQMIKIEELTLHTIEQQKQLDAQKEVLEKQEALIDSLLQELNK